MIKKNIWARSRGIGATGPKMMAARPKIRTTGSLMWVLGLGMWMALVGCQKQRTEEWTVDTSRFRNGDIILRCGFGMESKTVTLYSGGEYSHIGLLYQKEGMWYVVHAVPGETEDKDEPEYLKCEPIEEFLREDRAVRAAWGRIDCEDEVAKRAAEYALEKVRRKVLFDNDYVIEDTTEFYCSELVWQSYLHQGIDIAQNRGTHRTPAALKTEYCIYPRDIETDNHTVFIEKIGQND